MKKTAIILGAGTLFLAVCAGIYFFAVRHYTGVCRRAAELSGPDRAVLQASVEGCGTLLGILPPYPEVSPVPLNVFALLMRGGYNETLGNLEAAYRDKKLLLEVHEKAVKQGKTVPSVTGTYESLARLAAGLERPDESFLYADLAIQDGSKNARMYFMRGLGYVDRGEMRLALSDFMHAHALDPSCEPCRRNMEALLQAGK